MNKIVDLVLVHRHIFTIFSKVYLFGSCLNNDYPNDIDILLIYDKYSRDIESQKMIIELCLNSILRLPVDMTIMSKKELEQTKFLEKIQPKYIKLK